MTKKKKHFIQKNKSSKKKKKNWSKMDIFLKIILPILAILLTGGGIASRVWDHLAAKPEFIDCKSFEYGEFEPKKSELGLYESQPIESTKIFSMAAENRIWIKNPSNDNLKITGGKLKINSIKSLEEDQLQMILGTDNNTLYIYIVNNTFSDIGGKYFQLLPYEYYEPFPIKDKKGMKRLFQTSNFVRHIEKIPSGSVFKLFEFHLPSDAKEQVSKRVGEFNQLHSYLFTLRQYENKDDPIAKPEDEKFKTELSNPFALYYKDNELNYEYLSQGNSLPSPSGTNNIPIVYIDGLENDKQEYPININNELKKNDTECLVQYIVPNRSCTVTYSIELEVNGRSIKNDLLTEKKMKVRVPRYSIEEDIRARNEEAFSELLKNDINRSTFSSKNSFTDKFKFDSRKWMKTNLSESKEIDSD